MGYTLERYLTPFLLFIFMSKWKTSRNGELTLFIGTAEFIRQLREVCNIESKVFIIL